MVEFSEILKDNRKGRNTCMQNTYGFKATCATTPACYRFLTVTHSLHYPPVITCTTILRVLFPLRLDFFLGCRYPPPVPSPRSHVASTRFASDGAGKIMPLVSIYLLSGPFKHL